MGNTTEEACFQDVYRTRMGNKTTTDLLSAPLFICDGSVAACFKHNTALSYSTKSRRIRYTYSAHTSLTQHIPNYLRWYCVGATEGIGMCCVCATYVTSSVCGLLPQGNTRSFWVQGIRVGAPLAAGSAAHLLGSFRAVTVT